MSKGILLSADGTIKLHRYSERWNSAFVKHMHTITDADDAVSRGAAFQFPPLVCHVLTDKHLATRSPIPVAAQGGEGLRF
jgi:hypothetical protein